MFCILLISCTDIPIDSTPYWASNNRYGMEIINNCNSTTHSIGLSGCYFVEKPDDNSTITLPALWASRIQFISSNCDSKEYIVTSNQDLVVKIKDLYTNQNRESCSFEIIRNVTIGKRKLDAPILGRFFIQIVSNNPYYSPLNFRINKNIFKGVGWLQHKYQQINPQVTIYPQGTTGDFIMKCGEKTIYNFKFTTYPFQVLLPEGNNCDYEMAVINSDNPYMEFTSLIYEENKYTEDIKMPYTYVKKNKRYFSFRDDINNNSNQEVIGIKVNKSTCQSYYCTDKDGSDKYIVKAITASLRYFYGVYDPSNNSWEVK